MSVVVTCDICKQSMFLKPGEYTMNFQGWKWIRPASFQSSYHILPETQCEKCIKAIQDASEKAIIEAKKALTK